VRGPGSSRKTHVSSTFQHWKQCFLSGYSYGGVHRGTVMGLRWIFVLSVCFGVSPAAFASESSGILHRVSCSVIRFYVAKYSAPAAEQWARSKGATEAEIEEARHCLKAETTQAAKAPTRPFALGSYGW
jgi:hypothetical protein